jgi:glycosyltransferase involved in cell wall biosynthesis
MISKKKEKLYWILTDDLKINHTYTFRYISFLKKLIEKNKNTKAIGLLFPFKPHDLEDLSIDSSSDCTPQLAELTITDYNIVQKILLFIDRHQYPFWLKKSFFAIHIVIFKVDPWFVNPSNFKNLNAEPSIIISGGSGGIIKTSYLLSKKYNAKLVLDYRDPWNFGYHLLETDHLIHSFKRKFTLKTERKILDHAHHITTVSESLKGFFPKEYHHKITVIENGSNFEQDDILPQINAKPEKFSINYLGTIYNDQLFEEDFFKAFAEFYNLTENNSMMALNFIGADKNDRLKKIIKKYELGRVTKITKRVNKEELLPYLTNASIFLQLRFKERSQIVTSKITDYLMFRKPILLPVSDEGDMAEMIKKYQAGYICNTVEDTIASLQKEYQKFLNRESILIHQKDLSHLSRTEISKKLVKVIEGLEV